MGPPHRNVSTVSREVLANLGEVHNVEISRVTQQLLNGKFHDFLAVFALAHSKIIKLHNSMMKLSRRFLTRIALS